LTDATPSEVQALQGTTLIISAFQRGPTTARTLLHGSKSNYLRTRGQKYIYDYAPLCCEQFYQESEGRANLLTHRVVDGDEADSELYIYDRNVEVGDLGMIGAQQFPSGVGLLNSAFPGDSYGHENQFVGEVADVSAAIAGSVFTPDATTTMTINEWIGATFVLVFSGNTYTFTIASNTATTFTVSEGFGSITTAAVAAQWLVIKNNYTDINNVGLETGLSLKLTDGTQNQNGRFGMDLYDEGKQVTLADSRDLDLDSSGDYYYMDLINKLLTDENQWELEVETDNFTGDPTDERLRPANWADCAISVSSNVITMKTWRWESVVTAHSGGGTGNGYVSATASSGLRPHYFDITFTGGGAFDVEVYTYQGGTRLDDGTLPAGATGASAAFVADDRIRIYFRPMPITSGGTGLLPKRQGKFFVGAFSSTYDGGIADTAENYSIIDNTATTITVPLGTDLSNVVPLSDCIPNVTGSIIETYAINNETLIYDIDDGNGLAGPTTLTTVLVNPAATAAQVAAAIEVQDLATNDELTVSAVGGYVNVALDPAAHHSYGPNAILRITTGTLNPILGFVDNTNHTGAVPTVGRVEFRESMKHGKAGCHNLVDGDYTGTILDPAVGNTLVKTAVAGLGLGLITIGIPGISDVQIQQALSDYCFAKGYVAALTLPSATTTSDAARSWVRTNIIANRLVAPIFPSWGYLTEHPFEGKTNYLCPMMGFILGETAKIAVQQGYKQAPCGSTAQLGPGISYLTSDTFAGGPPLDDGPLNLAGIISIYHNGAAMYRNGDQIPDTSHIGRIWWHKIRSALHILHDLIENSMQFRYKPLNARLLKEARNVLYGRLEEYYDSDYFVGRTFKEAVQLQCDESNNDLGSGAGTLQADIGFFIIDTAWRIELNLGTGNLSVAAS
jgi:hypothetical protein